MKFTTLVPTKRNDGTVVPPSRLNRLIDSFWRPFRGMTNEGLVQGHWVDEEGTHFIDESVKLSVECGRDQLPQAIRAVKRLGRLLKQRAMYFEVSGYDGVQILPIE